ncbi:MAG: NAD-binding protein [Clostridia bacterium]|nr:NAD-binding protein [Clostridia bacterium]
MRQTLFFFEYEAVQHRGLLLAAISRNGKIIIPNGNTELLEGDSFFVTGLGTKVAAFRKKLKSGSKEDKMKKVMIGGGGKTGFYLAHMLTEDGVAVKIIEKDEKRCNYLAERLEKALVLNGNACNPTLLAEENLKNMDAFIAATGSDESNILLAILAQKNNVKDVIAKVSSNYYNSITDELDDTMTINPIDMCTSSILRKLTSGTSINFKKMIQGQAEFVEVLAEENMPITSDSLSNMDIPEGVIITTINRGKDVIIPTGSTQIMPGDKVVILALLTKVGELEALLSGTVHSM